MSQYFAGELVYTDPSGLRWKIERKPANNSNTRYWHATLIGGGNDHYVSVSCQRLLQNLDHPEITKGEAKRNGR